jgi:hypothetical protein
LGAITFGESGACDGGSGAGLVGRVSELSRVNRDGRRAVRGVLRVLLPLSECEESVEHDDGTRFERDNDNDSDERRLPVLDAASRVDGGGASVAARHRCTAARLVPRSINRAANDNNYTAKRVVERRFTIRE